MAAAERVPAVIASRVDVVYRVFGAGRAKPVSGDEEPGDLLSRLTDRRPQVGIREVHAVKDVSFTAFRGESIGLVGRNGSGKSTLLRTVAGLIPPTNGAVYINGRAALLGVNAVLMRKLSGARNIMIGAQALGLSKAEVQAKYDEIVEFADIGEFINLPMSSYSSGMAARLRFAISTAAVPDILVVDEALSTGDAQFKARANDRIQQIRDAAGTVFMVSHNNNTIKAQCTRALWMDAGHLVMDGPAAEVVEAYAKKYGARAKKAPPPRPAPAPVPQQAEAGGQEGADGGQKGAGGGQKGAGGGR